MTVREDIRNTAIIELIRTNPTSVRLYNALAKAEQDGTLPFKTVGDYLDAGPLAEGKSLHIRNLGKKTARELTQLIEAVATVNSLSMQ